jgi:hypothetical protein
VFRFSTLSDFSISFSFLDQRKSLLRANRRKISFGEGSIDSVVEYK